MTKVINLDDHRKVWANWHITCSDCGKEWIGTVHKDTKSVECPQCYEFTSMLSHKIKPVESQNETSN